MGEMALESIHCLFTFNMLVNTAQASRHKSSKVQVEHRLGVARRACSASVERLALRRARRSGT